MRRAKKGQIDTSLFDRIEKLEDQILAEGVYLDSPAGVVCRVVNPAIFELVNLCKRAGIKLPELDLTPAAQAA
jgi:hypothetical protein